MTSLKYLDDLLAPKITTFNHNLPLTSSGRTIHVYIDLSVYRSGILTSHTSFLLSLPQTQLSAGAFLQFNGNGILHCLLELSSILHSEYILAACLQESKMKSTKKAVNQVLQKLSPSPTSPPRISSLQSTFITFTSPLSPPVISISRKIITLFSTFVIIDFNEQYMTRRKKGKFLHCFFYSSCKTQNFLRLVR